MNVCYERGKEYFMYLVIARPGFLTRNRWHSMLNLPFSGEKQDTSSGWRACEVWGGSKKRMQLLAEAHLFTSIPTCDLCPSYNSSILSDPTLNLCKCSCKNWRNTEVFDQPLSVMLYPAPIVAPSISSGYFRLPVDKVKC